VTEFVLTPWQEKVVEAIFEAERLGVPLFINWPRQAGRALVEKEVRRRVSERRRGRGFRSDYVIYDEAVSFHQPELPDEWLDLFRPTGREPNETQETQDGTARNTSASTEVHDDRRPPRRDGH
jgi:hypothetical protein